MLSGIKYLPDVFEQIIKFQVKVSIQLKASKASSSSDRQEFANSSERISADLQ